MGGGEVDTRSAMSLPGFDPAQDTEAPPVSRIQAGKLEFRAGRGKVISPGGGKFQEFTGHDRTDHMVAVVSREASTKPIASVAGQGIATAKLERFPEHVADFWK